MLRRVLSADSNSAFLNIGTLLGLAMIAVVWAGVGFNLQGEWKQSQAGAQQTVDNLARVFEEHTNRVLREADKTIVLLRAIYTKDPKAFDPAVFARSPAVSDGIVRQFGLIGPDGLLKMNFSGPVRERVDLSDRAFFRTLRDAKSDILYSSTPLQYRTTGQWAIQIARAIHDDHGVFEGALGITVDPIHLIEYYQTIDLGQGGAIALIGLDGNCPGFRRF